MEAINIWKSHGRKKNGRDDYDVEEDVSHEIEIEYLLLNGEQLKIVAKLSSCWTYYVLDKF